MVADYLRDMNPFTSSILIISPLQSLMLDQVAKLRDIDINAAAIYSDQSEEVLKDIEEGGIFSVIFTSRESVNVGNRSLAKISLIHCILRGLCVCCI